MTDGTWSAAGYEAVADVLASHAGLDVMPSLCVGAEDGIRRVMARAGIAQLDRFLELLRSGGVELDDLIGELTVGETCFLRSPELFDVIRDALLPELARAHDSTHRLRVWSAGCAPGQARE